MPQPPTRSLTGKHRLLHSRTLVYVGGVASRDLSFFDLAVGPGTVLRKIWPAILVHTLFATAIVVVSHETKYDLGIQPVLLNVVGMVLGFVISYRAVSGYDRYWMGRSAWGDVIRNCRTLARLVWFHVPLRLQASKEGVTKEDAERILEEKKIFIDLIEGFAFALKHHLREEPGPYYEDLYPFLVALETSPFYEHRFELGVDDINSPQLPQGRLPVDGLPTHTGEYGTFETVHATENAPLLPATPPDRSQRVTQVYTDLIPGVSLFRRVRRWLSQNKEEHNGGYPPNSTTRMHHPTVASCGSSIPLDLIGCMSSYLATIEDRGTVPGMSLGPMVAALQGLEDCLTTLEKILATPLPFVYSAHIRHTVWIYLFFLPFQLTDTFGYYTIPSVAVAAFLYLGFMAAGEEIEQPFGYDNNDLDLDTFCRQIIHADLEEIRTISCPNSDLGIPGAVEKGSLVGNGVVVDAALRLQAEKRTSHHDTADPPTVLVTPALDPSFSDSSPAPAWKQGTSAQDIMIMSGSASVAM